MTLLVLVFVLLRVKSGRMVFDNCLVDEREREREYGEGLNLDQYDFLGGLTGISQSGT